MASDFLKDWDKGGHTNAHLQVIDTFEIITIIRPKNDEGIGDYQHDCVEIIANEKDLRLGYCECAEEKNSDGEYIIRRKSFSFDFSYEEFDKMVAAVSRARVIAMIAKGVYTKNNERNT